MIPSYTKFCRGLSSLSSLQSTLIHLNHIKHLSSLLSYDHSTSHAFVLYPSPLVAQLRVPESHLLLFILLFLAPFSPCLLWSFKFYRLMKETLRVITPKERWNERSWVVLSHGHFFTSRTTQYLHANWCLQQSETSFDSLKTAYCVCNASVA